MDHGLDTVPAMNIFTSWRRGIEVDPRSDNAKCVTTEVHLILSQLAVSQRSQSYWTTAPEHGADLKPQFSQSS